MQCFILSSWSYSFLPPITWLSQKCVKGIFKRAARRTINKWINRTGTNFSVNYDLLTANGQRINSYLLWYEEPATANSWLYRSFCFCSWVSGIIEGFVYPVYHLSFYEHKCLFSRLKNFLQNASSMLLERTVRGSISPPFQLTSVLQDCAPFSSSSLLKAR